MFKHRTRRPADHSQFRRSCNVFLEADGERAIVVHCYNHDGLTAEIPGTAILCARDNGDELGQVVMRALHGCTWQPDFDYSKSKRSDWPALQASEESSAAGFERRWKPVEIRGANDLNVTWVVEVSTAMDFSLSLTASVSPATDAGRLGEAILYVFDKSNGLAGH